VLLELSNTLLKAVPGGKVAAKEQLEAVGGYPALCVATFPTWYRCVRARWLTDPADRVLWIHVGSSTHQMQ